MGPVFAALADPTRRALVETLARRPTVTATTLAAELPMTRQAVAKHLSALREAELIEPHRQGREIHYTLVPDRLAEAAGWIAEVGGEWDERLGRLHALLGAAAPARRSSA